MARSRADLTPLIRRHVATLAAPVNRSLVRFLLIARELMGHDLDTVLIMLVIIQRANLHPDFRDVNPERVASGEYDEALPGLPMNIASIADSTGIPKETVRRKLNTLIKLGFVMRDESSLRYTAVGYQALDPARESLVDMIARIVEAVDETEEEEARSR